MIVSYKRYLRQSFSLLSEKMCFNSLEKAKHCDISEDTKKPIRFDFSITFLQESNLLAFSMLCLSSFFPKVSSFSVYGNSNRLFTKNALWSRNMFRALPFLFFSYVQIFVQSRFFFFWPSGFMSCHNRSIGVNCLSRSVSYDGFYDDYFYGVVDANSKYRIDIDVLLGKHFDEALAISLFASLLCIPFNNKMASK